MPTQSRSFANDIYFLKEGLNDQQLSSAINRCLCQAEALAMIAAIIDVEAVGSDIINNYLWMLSDIVREARVLHGYLADTYRGKIFKVTKGDVCPTFTRLNYVYF
jgi:hypothetical protein